MPLGPRELFLVIIVPALAALGVLALGRRIWRRDAGDRIGRWAGPISVALGFLIAFPSIVGRVAIFPPTESVSWMFVVAIVACVAGVMDAMLGRVWIARAGAVFLSGCAGVAVVLRFKIQQATAGEALLLIASIGVVIATWWMVLDYVERDETTASTFPWILWILATSLAVISATNGSLVHGQFGMALAGIAGAALVLALVFRRRVFLRGGAIVAASLLVLSAVGAYFLANVPSKFIVTLLAAPLAMLVGRVIPVAKAPAPIRVLVRLAPLALMMAIITAISVVDFRKHQNDTGGESDPYSFSHPVGKFTPTIAFSTYN